MSLDLVHALQNGTKVADIPARANVSINVGNGNSNIAVTARNANINTGCGNQNITAVVTNNLNISTGFNGQDVISAQVGGNANIATYGGNDYINLDVKGNFNVNAGAQICPCGCQTDDDIVLIRGNENNYGGHNSVSTGSGTDNIRIIANNVDLKKADGTMILGFYGDGYNINSAASTNIIGFWGDNINMKITGSGYQDIKTLDFSFAEGNFTDFGFQDLMAQETYMGSSYDTIVSERLTGKDNLDQIAKKYNLTSAQVEQLRSLDLTKQTPKGQPYYLLYKDGNTYNIGYRDDSNNIYSLSGKKLNYNTSSTSTQWSGNYYRYNTTTSTAQYTGSANLDVEREKEITTQKIRTDYYNIDGVRNVNIDIVKDGQYNVGITAKDGYININGKSSLDETAQNILVRGGYIQKDTQISTDVKYVMEKLSLSAGTLAKSVSTTSTGWYYYNPDPLVLDTNKDGVVSTIKSNFGVDINLDGKADGAATGGDKMLAMSDLNGNGQIDGAEVFGDQTVSPFTKKKLNAANGFEALKLIAQEAKQYTGIDCMNGNEVDVQKLAEALAKKGIKLGLIGDTNIKNLEGLGDVKSINVDYKKVDAEGAIQHTEKSTYTDLSGKQWQVDDVRFQA